MPDPLKPMIPRPEQVKPVKSGEAHITYGCLMLIGGLLVLAGVVYTFRDFFFENALYSIIGLMILSAIIKAIMFWIKGK